MPMHDAIVNREHHVYPSCNFGLRLRLGYPDRRLLPCKQERRATHNLHGVGMQEIYEYEPRTYCAAAGGSLGEDVNALVNGSTTDTAI